MFPAKAPVSESDPTCHRKILTHFLRFVDFLHNFSFINKGSLESQGKTVQLYKGVQVHPPTKTSSSQAEWQRWAQPQSPVLSSIQGMG